MYLSRMHESMVIQPAVTSGTSYHTWHGQIGLNLFGEFISFIERAKCSHFLNTELLTVRLCSYVLLPAGVSSGTSQEVLRNRSKQ